MRTRTQAAVDRLNKQGLNVRTSVDVKGAFMYAVDDYILNTEQLLTLESEGKLNLAGIKELDAKLRAEGK